jgi:thiol-disulfide isomerase/thioredoxin
MLGRVALAVMLGCLSTTFARAQEAQESPKLPEDPAVWINGGPVTAEMLKGKAAFLWFFEEQCPRCREKWSDLKALSEQFEDQPIAFIAVNSGNSRDVMEAYAKDAKVPWPILVDANRELERACFEGKEISLQNITQVQLVMPDGKFQAGQWNDVQGSATQAVKDAKWSGDPAQVPPSLLPAWRGIQFGLYQKSAPSIVGALTSADAAEKAMAEQLQGFVQGKIANQMQAAKDAHRAGEKWKSYKMVTAIPAQFAGYTIPEGVAKAKSALANDEQVRGELTARTELEALKKRARTATPASMPGLIVKLKQIADKYAATEAGAEAKELLAQAPQN